MEVHERLTKWAHVSKALRDGWSIKRVSRELGPAVETVRKVRRLMEDAGWTPPGRDSKRKPEVNADGKRRSLMTEDERLRKYRKVAQWLRAGVAFGEVCSLTGVGPNTVKTVRLILVKRGEVEAPKKRRRK